MGPSSDGEVSVSSSATKDRVSFKYTLRHLYFGISFFTGRQAVQLYMETSSWEAVATERQQHWFTVRQESIRNGTHEKGISSSSFSSSHIYGDG